VNEVSTRILSSLLESRTGQQLSVGRRWRIETALQSLMRELRQSSLEQLLSKIVSGRDPALADQVVDALLNNETYFYRDRRPFDLLLGAPLERLRGSRLREKRIRIWCAGCSTGQEAYSLAMSFAEQQERWRGWTIDILGTDVSSTAIGYARQGLYSQFEVQRGLPVMQMIRWFSEEEGRKWQIAPELRAAVRFEVRSLAEVPPSPGRFDIILCRNVLLYFAAPLRQAVFARLEEASALDAILMLGAGETTIGQTSAFICDAENRGLYVRTPGQCQVSVRQFASA
jgi:chemotaxis protein methyltransferase CheR